ncbi:hypothetical protein [Crocosphaera sp. Alani8]
MKPIRIIIDITAIGCLLIGVGVSFDKIESASLSNPFTTRTAQLHKNN